MAKAKVENKGALMSAIGLDYAVIEAAEAEVTKLRVQAAPKIKEIVAAFGPGPHKMPVPDAAGESRDYIVNFRKAGDTFAVSAVSIDSVT